MGISIQEEEQSSTMPFSGHTAEDLNMILLWLGSTELPLECFDTFLKAYRDSGDLWYAREAAFSEWDC